MVQGGGGVFLSNKSDDIFKNEPKVVCAMLRKIIRAFEVLLIERRLPYAWAAAIQSSLYEKPLKECLGKVVDTRPIPCQQDAEAELHLVTCRKDTTMAIMAIKSLLRFVPNLAVVIHGDESLDEESIAIIRRSIPNCRVVTYDESSKVVIDSLDIVSLRAKVADLFCLDSSYDRHKRAWALKIFDFHLFSNSQRIIVLDSDTLFLKRPDEIIDWMNMVDAPAFYAIPDEPNLKIKESLYREVFPRANVIRSFNGGLLGFNKSSISLDMLVDMAQTLLEHPEVSIYGDECVWRFVYSLVDSKPLPFEFYPLFESKKRYQQMSSVQSQFKYMHFLLKHKEGLYHEIAQEVLSELD